MAVTRMSGSSIADYNKSNQMSGAKQPAGSGGTETTSGGFRYHAFTGNGSFVLSRDASVDYLIVAGGGGGGAAGSGGSGGGGGGGGLLIGTVSLTAGSYAIVVGAGGAGNTDQNSPGSSGINSTAFGLTANGSGGGGSSNSLNGASGASGGGGGASGSSPGVGGAANNLITFATDGTYNVGAFAGEQGCTGGQAISTQGGGGGGASMPGQEGTGAGFEVSGSPPFIYPGMGGFGRRLDDWGNATGEGDSYSTTGSNAVYFAGGGTGGRTDSDLRGTVPGGGGIGAGTGAAGNGDANTGGGGGGGHDTNYGGSGGSGIVIVRYAV